MITKGDFLMYCLINKNSNIDSTNCTIQCIVYMIIEQTTLIMSAVLKLIQKSDFLKIKKSEETNLIIQLSVTWN